MTPQELRAEILRATNEWNETHMGSPLTDIASVANAQRELNHLILWAIGRIIAMLDDVTRTAAPDATAPSGPPAGAGKLTPR